MQITIDIPDKLIEQSVPLGQNPARIVLEDALVEAYREDRISGRELMEALGIETRYELDGFLKARRVWIEHTWEQMQHDRAVMEAHMASV